MSSAKCFFVFSVVMAAGHRCPGHGHPCTEIVWCDGAAGWLHHHHQRRRYTPGDVFTYQPGAEHLVRNDVAGRHLCLGVNGCGADLLPVTVCRATPELCQRLTRVAELSGDEPLVAAERDLLAGLVVLELRRLLAPPPSEAEQDRAHAAKAILDTRFAEPLSIREVASSLYVSPDYLRQLFKSQFGDAPLHYLLRKRIAYAEHLLRETDWPVQRVAAACGIPNPYYFSRLFRKLTGHPPSASRG